MNRLTEEQKSDEDPDPEWWANQIKAEMARRKRGLRVGERRATGGALTADRAAELMCDAQREADRPKRPNWAPPWVWYVAIVLFFVVTAFLPRDKA